MTQAQESPAAPTGGGPPSTTLAPVVHGPAPWKWAPVDPVPAPSADPAAPPAPHPPSAELGALADFRGTWTGKGFNTIFRPHFGNDGVGDNVLELNLTLDTISFADSLGAVPNRGMVQADIFLNGMPYQQTVSDVTFPGPPVGIHAEPGLWMSVPATSAPAEGQTYARLASIPHGTTILAQGTATTAAGAPTIPAVDITPSVVGGAKNRFPSQTAGAPSNARIPSDLTTWISAGTITQADLDDPNSKLREANVGKTIVSTTTIHVKGAPDTPLFGGGEDNIAFLLGDTAASRPNAQVVSVEATFWIETVQVTASTTTRQIQYSQTVVLRFNGLDWPHVSVGTLTPVPQTVHGVSTAEVGAQLHVVAVRDGKLVHTFRDAAGSWQGGLDVVETQESNDPGPFTSVSCSAVGDDLHLVGVAAGGLWHTIRFANNTWQRQFDSVGAQAGNKPDAFDSVACAGYGASLEVVGTVAGVLWLTVRRADGTWQPLSNPIPE